MTLKYTPDESRKRVAAMIGREGLPQPWWPLAGGNDCVGFLLERLGVRTARDYAAKHISIAAFRRAYGWDEIAPSRLQPGDLIAENWTGARDKASGNLVPEHLEYVYSVDHDSDRLVIIAANTGPRVGTAHPRGVWQKTRPLDEHILFGIRPPYKTAAPTRSRKATVQRIAAYLNATVKADIPRTAAADDGVEGTNYWRLVQTWGRERDLYGPTYRIDGIPGPRTRTVETAADKASRAKA